MSDQSNKKHQDKVVFTLANGVADVKSTSNQFIYDFVGKRIQFYLDQYEVDTDLIFLGGSKESISTWIGNIIYDFESLQFCVDDSTPMYFSDPDFGPAIDL